MAGTVQIETHSFRVGIDMLFCDTVPRRSGKPYTHSCDIVLFERIAAEIDGRFTNTGCWFRAESLAQDSDWPVSAAYVALRFMLERGILGVDHGRWSVEEGHLGGVYEHAMIEFYALREEGSS